MHMGAARKAAVLGLVMLGARAAASAPPGKPVIVRKSRERIEVAEVTQDNYKEVVYKISNVPDVQRIAAREVAEIILPDLHDGVAKGKDLRAKSEWDKAIAQFQLAAEKETGWRKQYPLFLLAETYWQWSAVEKSRVDSAIGAYQKLLDAVKDTRYLATARLRIAQCQLAKKDYAKAEEIFTSIENEARDKFGIEWEVEAKYWKAFTVEQQAKYGEAKALYASLERTAKTARDGAKPSSPEASRLAELETQALVKQGECLIKAGNLDEAQRFYESLLKGTNGSSRADLKAGAFNGLGQVLFSKKRFEEARYQFASVVACNAQNREEYQRALYWLGRSYEELAAKGEKNAGLRAVEYFKDCVAVDPSSPIASEARARVK